MEKRNKYSKLYRKKMSLIRTFTQAVFFFLIALVSINRTLEASGIGIPFVSNASLHALCPFGGVVSFYRLATTGAFIQKIHESSFVLMALIFILAIILGPVFCGWICPLGSFQEWLGNIGKKIFKKKYNNFINPRIDKILRFLRYLVLVLVIYNTAATARLVFQNVDPYFALFNFWTNEVAITAYVVLGATIVLSFFIERPWCKYACPYGALLGIFNLFRISKLRRNPKTCINCKVCDKVCPMNITVSDKTTIRDHQCISCMKCTSEICCPVQETVGFGIYGGKEK